MRSLAACLPALSLALLLATPPPAWAQAELWLAPTLGQLRPRTEYGLTVYPDEPVRGQPTDLAITQHRLSLSTPLAQDPQDEWSASVSLRFQETDTRAVLPDTGDRFPPELWDARLGLTYRHRFEHDRIAGGNLTVGSPSDRPFASEDEVVVRATAFLRVPARQHDAWLLTLNYSNHQEVLSGVPVPGIAYLHAPSDRLRVIIGVPFTALDVRPLERTTLQLTYIPLRRVRARAMYEVLPPLRVYAGFDWDHEFHLRASRPDPEDRLFYYEKRLTAGLRFDLRHVGVEVAGGYAFDRFAFEGESYSDRHDHRIDVADGPFLTARASVRF
jgi:hypothetical protein